MSQSRPAGLDFAIKFLSPAVMEFFESICCFSMNAAEHFDKVSAIVSDSGGVFDAVDDESADEIVADDGAADWLGIDAAIFPDAQMDAGIAKVQPVPFPNEADQVATAAPSETAPPAVMQVYRHRLL